METPLPPCKGAGRGVYYHLARRTGVRMARRTLKTGYCESKTDSQEKNKLASNEFIFNLKRTHPPGPPSGRVPPRSNGEFDPGSG